MDQTAWLVRRAMMALLLMAGFYALAIGIAAALVWVPYEAYLHHISLPAKIVLACIGLAGTILWSIVPRIDRFMPPGPQLTRNDTPALFEMLSDIASATGQPMPAHVYLASDVNAFVTHRGGVMGVGARRVMGIGLPLMQSLTVQELKAVVAHEFGHYHAGDVKVGPWIYKTRAAIGRTVQQLAHNPFQRAFVAYGNLFLRTTHAISRRQEFIADEIAARVAGSRPMASALRKVHGAALAFHHYWMSEVTPLLDAGFAPPLAEGFARFSSAAAIRANVGKAIEAAESDTEANPYDTHPPLRERLTALGNGPDTSGHDDRPAIDLLGNAARWERKLLAAQRGLEWAKSLTPVAWESAIQTVYVPQWREVLRQNRRVLDGVDPAAPPFARALAGKPNLTAADQVTLRIIHMFSLALSLSLFEAGWTITTAPGESIGFVRDGQSIHPFPAVMEIATGTVDALRWAERWRGLGLGAAFRDFSR